MNSDDDPSFTRKQFCALERISLSFYHGLQQRGLGPDEMRFPHSPMVRITAKSRAEWHRRMEDLRNSEAVLLEAARRRDRAAEAGRIAAQSPLHVSKRLLCNEKQRRRRTESGR